MRLHKTGVVELNNLLSSLHVSSMDVSLLELLIGLRFSFLSGRMEYMDVYIKVRVFFR